MPFERVKVLMADTRTSVNQGGASGSTGIQHGGKQMRAAAAEARRVLVEMAAAEARLPADQLTVTDGVVHAKSDPAKKASYAELIGGRYFNVQLDWNKQIGNALYAPGKAKPKDPKEYKIVGKPIKRADIAPKVFCTGAVRHRREGARHGACPHDPPAGRGRDAGQDRRSLDQGHPGARVVRENNFLAVVADKEWDAIKALQTAQGRVVGRGKPPFPDQAALYDHIRKAPVRKREDIKPVGNVDEAFKTAARVIEAEYEWPFQSHACMGPACAVVEIKDGHVDLLDRLAEAALRARRHRRAPSACRSTRSTASGWSGPAPTAATTPTTAPWTPPCSPRRSASRCACNTCASKAPAGTRRARPRSTAPARRSTPPARSSAYEFLSKGFSRFDVQTNGSQPRDTLAGHFRGVPLQGQRRLRRAGGILRVRQQAHALGDDRAAARARLAAAQRASARSGRARRSISPASRSWTRWPPRSASIRSSSACGTSRTRATSRCSRRRRRSRAGSRGPRRARTRAATRSAAAASPTAQRNGTVVRDRRRGRRRPPHRQDLGAQVHGRARLRPDHQPGRPQAHDRGQHHPGHQPHAVGGGQVRPARTSPASTG